MGKNCITCNHPGKDCIPYLMTFSNAQLLEWARMRRAALHMSYEDLSEKSGIPLGTIERMMSRKGTDCRFTTAQPVIRVLSGCTPDQLDCESIQQPDEALLEQLNAKEAIIQHMQETLLNQNHQIDNMQSMADKRMEQAKTEESESVKYLKKKEKGYIRIIITLSITLAATLFIVIAALAIDKINPTIGFFWR